MHDIERWFRDYYPSLTAFAWKMIKDQEAAKEIVQELFLSLYEKQETLSISHSPKSYLFQAVRNRCLNHLTRQPKHLQVSLTEVQQQSDHFSDPIEAVEFEQQLYHWISQLPTSCQQIFRMSRFEGKKNQEIAEILSISKRTVETQISKALKVLRKKLKESEMPAHKRSQLLSIFL